MAEIYGKGVGSRGAGEQGKLNLLSPLPFWFMLATFGFLKLPTGETFKIQNGIVLFHIIYLFT